MSKYHEPGSAPLSGRYSQGPVDDRAPRVWLKQTRYSSPPPMLLGLGSMARVSSESTAIAKCPLASEQPEVAALRYVYSSKIQSVNTRQFAFFILRSLHFSELLAKGCLGIAS
jgi:hypothetical protein